MKKEERGLSKTKSSKVSKVSDTALRGGASISPRRGVFIPPALLVVEGLPE